MAAWLIGCSTNERLHTPRKHSYNNQLMKFIFHLRMTIACFALFSMLFMQLAAASYTCPMMTMDFSANADYSAMTDCDGMDVPQPTLCHTHANGEAAKQVLDRSELPLVAPFVAARFTLTLAVIDVMPVITAPTSLLLVRSTSPPLAIRHCCFRI